MSDGIWLEVSRVRIENATVSVQVVGDKRDDKPAWWTLEEEALGEDPGRRTYNAIATGLDKADQVVIAELGPKDSGNPKESDKKCKLVCISIRIQTR
jgi:hypothetical protein